MNQHTQLYTLFSKGAPKLAKQDSVPRFGGLSLPVLIGRRKVIVTPITDFAGVRSESQVDSTYDVTSCTEVESLSGTPLPDADTPPKKPFLFNAAARLQLSETKLGPRRVKPEDRVKAEKFGEFVTGDHFIRRADEDGDKEATDDDVERIPQGTREDSDESEPAESDSDGMARGGIWHHFVPASTLAQGHL